MLISERRGEIVIIAGRNETKMAAVKHLHGEGFHVLADLALADSCVGHGRARTRDRGVTARDGHGRGAFPPPIGRLKIRYSLAQVVPGVEPGLVVLPDLANGSFWIPWLPRWVWVVMEGSRRYSFFGFHSRASRWALANCWGVISVAIISRFILPPSCPLLAARFDHI